MRPLISFPLLAFCLAACATSPGGQSTPFLPAGVFGMYDDDDVGAINQSAWAFASSANTKGNPAAAATAVVALEYLPGELKNSRRWGGIDPSIPPRLDEARKTVRGILGIRPDASPQAVVNAMLALNLDLRAGNRAAALQVLALPLFTLPPERTLDILSNLPYVQQANLATARAADEAFKADMSK
jgi:hypothetical protein